MDISHPSHIISVSMLQSNGNVHLIVTFKAFHVSCSQINNSVQCLFVWLSKINVIVG